MAVANKKGLTNKEKAGLIGATVAIAGGLTAYGIYEVASGAGVITSCKQTYAALSTQYFNTLQKYIIEDNGAALTASQQSNLNFIQTEMNNQLNECGKLANGLTTIEDDVGYGLAILLTLTGAGIALAVLKKTGRAPPKIKNPPNSQQLIAYYMPIQLQRLLDEGIISQEEASAQIDYLNDLKTNLITQSNAAYDYYVEIGLITAAAAAALAVAAATAISDGIEIAIGIAAAAA
jgi:hypothetical protein